MTKRIRKSVFETNSSSSHSLTMEPGEMVAVPFPQHVLRGGVVEVSLAEYGWEWFRYFQPANKLSYLFTQLTQGNLPDVSGEELTRVLLEENERLALLARIVKEHTGCDLRFMRSSGYIDHDSVGVGTELFADADKLKAFLFGASQYVQTGNDNDDIPFVIGTDTGEQYVYPQLTVQEELSVEMLQGVTLRVVNRTVDGLVTDKGAYLSESEFNTELYAAVRQHAVAFSGTHIERSPYVQPDHDGHYARRAQPKLAKALGGLGLRMHRSLRADYKTERTKEGFDDVLNVRMYMPKWLADQVQALPATPEVLLKLASAFDRHEHFTNMVKEGGEKPPTWATKGVKEAAREVSLLCDEAAAEGVLF